MSWWASGAQPVRGRPALSEMPAGRGAGGAESQRVGGLTGGVVPVPAGRGGLRAHGLRDARAVVGHAALADIGAVAAAGSGESADCAKASAAESQVRGGGGRGGSAKQGGTRTGGEGDDLEGGEHVGEDGGVLGNKREGSRRCV